MTAQPTSAAPPSGVDKNLSGQIDKLMALGSTGYIWVLVDEALRNELGIDGLTRCKKASGSGRAANVLTESNDKDIALYVIFIISPYTVEQFRSVAPDRISRFP